MIRLVVLLVLALASSIRADPALDVIRSSLKEIRGNRPADTALRGATPQLTLVKHQLRNWVVSRLTREPVGFDELKIEADLNGELRRADLLCEEKHAGRDACPDGSLLGRLGTITLRRTGPFLMLQTRVGILCGYDESAYLYSRTGSGWERVWQSEQNVYTRGTYKPQTIHALLVSPYDRGTDTVVLTLGSRPWCSSLWHPVYYRAFRIGHDLEAPAILEGEELAYLGDETPILGSVTREAVLVEFSVASMDPVVHHRRAVRNFRLSGATAERTHPLALSPRDFVEEWLTQNWEQSAIWSDLKARRSLAVRHNELHKGHPAVEFVYPTMHCAGSPDLWEVGLKPTAPSEADHGKRQSVYFLVRWRRPYTFSMVELSERPSPACGEEDPDADAPRTLFAGAAR